MRDSSVSRARQAAAAAGLTALCLVLFLPGLRSIPAIDRDEARYAQATRQMLESGDFVDIRFQDAPRHKKPAGIHWLQAAFVAVSGASESDIAAYRVPSLLGAIAAVLLTATAGARLFGLAAGCLGAAMLASTLLLAVQARLATTDAALLAAVVAAQGALAQAYLAGPTPPRRAWAVFWIAVAVGVLIKGPVVLLVSGGTVLALVAFDRSLGWLLHLRPLGGAALALAIAAPWFLAIGWKTGGEFFAASVGRDVLGKLIEGQESHGAPPGYHLLAFWIAFWPFSFLAACALPWAWARRGAPAVRFCAAWILPAWIVFEITATKLPHYVLPLYPAIALLAAAFVDDIAGAPPSGLPRKMALGLFALAGAVCTLAVVVAPIFLERRFEPLALLAAIASLGGCLASVVLFGKGRARAAAAALIGAAIVLYACAFGIVAPRLDMLWTSQRVGNLVARVSRCPERRIASVGYHEPSLVFALGTHTRLVGPSLAAQSLQADPRCALVLTTSGGERELRDELARRSIAARRMGGVDGLVYSTGRWVTLSLWGVEAPGLGVRGQFDR